MSVEPISPGRWWLPALAYALLLALLGCFTKAWWRPLNFDEVNYYVAPLRFFTDPAQPFSLRDYPFVSPPVGLLAQAAVLKVTGELFSVRWFSTVCAVALALYLFLTTPPGRDRWLRNFALLTFPFFLWNAFTLKHHVLTMGLLLVALDRWSIGERHGSRAECSAAGVLLALATLSNQFCVPICAALGAEAVLDVWRERRTPEARSFPIFRLLIAAIPVVLLAGLMLYWQGTCPPGFVHPFPQEESAAPAHRLAQLTLGVMSIGAWIGPLLVVKPRRWLLIAALWLASSALVHLSGLFRAGNDFWKTPQGPISLCLLKLDRVLPGTAVLGSGLLVAMAILALAQPPASSLPIGKVRLLATFYLLLTAFAVGPLFESYYLFLIVPLFFWITANSAARDCLVPQRWFFAFSIAASVGYAAFKIRF